MVLTTSCACFNVKRAQPFVYPPIERVQLPAELPACTEELQWNTASLDGVLGAPDVILVCMDKGGGVWAWHAFVLVEVK